MPTEEGTRSTRIALLGVPVVERGGQAVRFDTRKAVALLAVLAVSGREERRDHLTALLWPESEGRRARAVFRRTLSVTAAALGSSLRISSQTVALEPGLVEVDLRQFEALAAAGDRESWELASALYRDDFMAGFSLRDSPEFDDWQASTAEHFRLLLAGALERVVRARTEAGELEGALETAHRWLALDSLHEPAHQALLQLYAWTGQRSAAVRQYRTCVRVLDEELGVRPLPQTTALYEAAVVQRSAAPAALSPPPPALARKQDPFIGREAELAALRCSWDEARTAGAVAVLVGESGVGKSILVRHFTDEVERLGGPQVSIRAHHGESTLTYAVATDILNACLAHRPELASELRPHLVSETSRLLPELRPHGHRPASGVESPAALTRLYAALSETIATALAPTARPGPAGVLVVEDCQYADPRSLDLIAYLVRRLGEVRILVVLSWTPGDHEVPSGLATALAEVAGSHRHLQLRLQRFSEQEVGDLVEAAGLGPDHRSRLVEVTGGLPLLVHEYAELLRREGPAAVDHVPPSVREVIAARLEAAGEPTLQLLTAAATLGGAFDPELLRAVSGRGEGEVAEGLDLAVRRGLVAEMTPTAADSPPNYGFPYEVLRRLAYERNSGARRRLLHGRAADALLRRRERDPAEVLPARLAEHLERAGRNEAAAEWWWRAAARARSLYAHEQAHRNLVRAMELGYPKLDALIADGQVLIALGRYQEALAALLGASAASPDSATAAGIEHTLAEVHHRLGDWELAEGHLEAALELVPAGERARRARLEADLALLHYRRSQPAMARKQADQALKLATIARDGSAMAQALNVLGMLAGQRGESEAASALLRDSLARAQVGGDVPAQVAALNNLSRTLAHSGMADEALAAATEALQLGGELADQHRVAALHTNLADLLHARGSHAAAREHLLASAERFARVDSPESPRPEVWTLVEW
jgi:DNA-binding SARP family transcriptional activator